MVIAMVVIGAGVSFIRTFFAAGTDSLIGAFDGVGDLGMTPDRNNLFIVDRETISGSVSGDLIILRAAIYNPTTNPWEDIKFIEQIDCSGPSDTFSPEDITVESVAQTIPAGNHAGYQVGIRIKESTDDEPTELEQEPYICMLQLESEVNDGPDTEDLPTKQITVELLQ